jgi:DNA-binding NtrC family response regulator
MASVLVVDDDPSTVSGLERLLTEDGHDVTTFTSGADALQALASQPFDAVVTDLEMPRVDGHAIVKATRKHQPHACVVVSSTLPDERYRELVDAGACIIADKPFEYEEVTKAVMECLARGGPGPHGKCHMRMRPEGHRLVPLRRK